MANKVVGYISVIHIPHTTVNGTDISLFIGLGKKSFKAKVIQQTVFNVR